MTYRDTFEKCPRCGIDLTDARSARGCRQCGGRWVDEQVLTEMVLEMLPPRPLSQLVLAVIERTDPAIGCPSCGAKMEPVEIHEVVLDRCGKHGVWFDAHELEQALLRVAAPGAEPPLAELVGGVRPRVEQARRIDPAMARSRITIRIHPPPGGTPHDVTLVDRSIIKIGRLESSHVRLEGDADVSRMHAVLEVTDDGSLQLIDLGSAAGTFVNGERVSRSAIVEGDHLLIGATVLHVVAIRLT